MYSTALTDDRYTCFIRLAYATGLTVESAKGAKEELIARDLHDIEFNSFWAGHLRDLEVITISVVGDRARTLSLFLPRTKITGYL